MKKNYIFMLLIFILGCNNFLLYEHVITRDLKIISDLTFEFDTNPLIKDTTNDETEGSFDTSKLGEQIYIDDNYYIKYNVVDTKKPLILGGSTKTTTKGKNIDLINAFLCGDNYDDEPKKEIIGEYDINTIGSYKLTYKAQDSSGNIETKDFTLKVVEPTSNSSSPSKVNRTPLKTYIKKYKNDKTSIGIDVSAWQDDIDWKKVKNDGVEFAMIRIGFGHTNSGEIKLDNWYKNNIKKAKEQGIKVGLYFYSYASSIKEVQEQTKWILDTLDHEPLDLPIAFDWEDWGDFNSYKVSFKKLNDIAKTFISDIEKEGYTGMLYGSAYYLNRIWDNYDKTWLAYYTDNNDYEKPFMMWQLTSTAEVNGIEGSVDVDILYK